MFASFWHFGLARGFREYLIAFAIMSVGYCMLACCLAEMVSVIAFPGGYYGYARCTVHPFFGYLVGCSGVIETVFVTAATVLRIGEVFTIVLGLPKKLEPLWWVLIHGSAIIVHVQPQQFYWYLMMVVTACCVLVLLTFLLGSTAVADFNKYSNIPHTKVDIFQSDWLEILSLPAIFYYGCDLVVVVANQVPNSKTVIPRAMLLGYATMAIVAVAIIFGTVSQSPGLSGKLFTIVFPLAFGFQTLFHITLNQATAYIIAPLISSLMGYMFVSSRMISSFARSGLLPAVLKPKRTGTTIAASSLTSMLATSAVGLCLQSVAWYYDTGISFRSALHAAFFVYIGMFVCYVVFKLRYSHLVRNFKSPFGVPGAILGFTIFTFAITSLMLSAINNIASCIYATSMGIFIIYYFLHAEAQQSFSAQEQQDFFKVYLINCKNAFFTCCTCRDFCVLQ